MKGRDNWVLWIAFLPIMFVLMNAVWNPANMLLLNTTKSNQPVTADCQNYKNQVDQQQTEISRLNKDISDCRNQSQGGFSFTELILGIAIGAGIAGYWFWQNEKRMKEKYESQKVKKRIGK